MRMMKTYDTVLKKIFFSSIHSKLTQIQDEAANAGLAHPVQFDCIACIDRARLAR
jgi:hypothetical protein